MLPNPDNNCANGLFHPHPARAALVTHATEYGKVKLQRHESGKLALVGIFLIKFSSLSAPTKIEELTAGSGCVFFV